MRPTSRTARHSPTVTTSINEVRTSIPEFRTSITALPFVAAALKELRLSMHRQRKGTLSRIPVRSAALITAASPGGTHPAAGRASAEQALSARVERSTEVAGSEVDHTAAAKVTGNGIAREERNCGDGDRNHAR